MSESIETFDPSVSAQARDWVLRLSSGEMDAAEIDRLKAWLAESEIHARAFEQRRSLWLELADRAELLPPAAPPALRRWHDTWRQAGRRHRVAIAATAVAASVLAVIIAPEVVLRIESDHRTSAEVAHYTLPDGSTAWLDADSAINVDFDVRERKVTLLRGNAFFTVRHGENRPFRVAALQGSVEDIGTSFEVRRQAFRVDVAVTDGAVRVAPGIQGHQNVVLLAGESVGYDAAGVLLARARPSAAAIAAWRNRELMIDRQSLPAAIGEIARYRNGPTWVWADLSERPAVNGAFRIDNANSALRDLAAAQGLTIIWLPGDIAIIRPGERP